MDLLSYFRVLRRRWFVIVVCLVVGAGIGIATTLVRSDETVTRTRSYYKATNTLLLSNAGGSGSFASSFTNLDQVAVLTTTGPVPEAVAKQLGGGSTGRELAQQITTLTNPTSNTLEITAIAPSGDRAVQLADAFSDALLANISATDQARYTKASTDASSRLDTLQGKINDVIAQIAKQPLLANTDVLQSQLRALENEYTTAYSDFQSVASQQAPVNPFSTLEKAQSIPIDSTEYHARLAQGELGQNNLQSGPNGTSLATASSGSTVTLNGKVPRGVLGGVLGLLVGIGLALLLEHLDRRIRTRADAEAAFGLPVLAEVPELSAFERRNYVILADAQPLSRTAEAYRAVRSALLFHWATDRGNDGALLAPDDDGDSLFEPPSGAPLVVMVTSAAPKEGKTTTSANLAAVFAEAGSRVLVLNCDFRRPMIHWYFGIPDVPRRVHRTQIADVKVITNVVAEADANPARVIAMQRQLIAAARDQFDVVILDTAPLLSANDAVEVMPDVDVVVLVSRAEVTTAPAAHRAMDMLARIEAPMVGVVLAACDEGRDTYYAYYQSRSGVAPKKSKKRRSNGAGLNGNGQKAHDELVDYDPGDQLHQPER